MNGGELPVGVYVYTLVVEFEDGASEMLPGELVWMR